MKRKRWKGRGKSGWSSCEPREKCREKKEEWEREGERAWNETGESRDEGEMDRRKRKEKKIKRKKGEGCVRWGERERDVKNTILAQLLHSSKAYWDRAIVGFRL